MFNLGKKKDKNDFSGMDAGPVTEPKTGPPTDLVISMRQQGLSNNQIVQNLQKEGYNHTQIFDALNQADVKSNVEGYQPGAISPEQMNPPLPQQQAPPAQPNQTPPFQPQTSPPFENRDVDERIEEVAEAIIDEKWNELVKNINKIIEWKDKTESRIEQIEQKFTDLKTDFSNLHKGILGKIGEYDQNITSVGAEIKAMEKVFQKILPSLTENVNELSRLTKDIKKKKK